MKKTRMKTGRWPICIAGALAIVLAMGIPAYTATDTDTEKYTQASVTFTAGELILKSAPVLDFGSHDITGSEQRVLAASVSPAIQVSDLRGSTGGWTLMATLSPFTMIDGGQETLKAASIQISKSTVSAVDGNIGTPPAATPNLELPSDGTETPVWVAGSGEGMGVWNLNWAAADTVLVIKPGTAQKGTSVATINWSLQSAP